MLHLHDSVELIMVTYHRPNDFSRCLQSILANTRGFHLSIIDNSCGGLDDRLALFSNDQRITIYRNQQNLGKGNSFKHWYAQIMRNNRADHFISIDSDLLVPPNWLLQLQNAYYRIRSRYRSGLLAPTIITNETDTFERQIAAGRLVMHDARELYEALPGIYYNRYTAGPLLLIDREFYENVGGYVCDQLYGNDDGRLCAAAAKQGRFIGIIATVGVQHLIADETDGYRAWKQRNVHGNIDAHGYWDHHGRS